MVEKLKPDEVAAFKEAFDMFDRKQDGTISPKVMLTTHRIIKSENLLLSAPRDSRSNTVMVLPASCHFLM